MLITGHGIVYGNAGLAIAARPLEFPPLCITQHERRRLYLKLGQGTSIVGKVQQQKTSGKTGKGDTQLTPVYTFKALHINFNAYIGYILKLLFTYKENTESLHFYIIL